MGNNKSIVKLDESYDIWLCHSWNNYKNCKEGISGHVFEIIEYYLILKKHFKVGIFFCDGMSKEIFKKSIKQRYNLKDNNIDKIINDTYIYKDPKLVFGKNVIMVDGGRTKLCVRTLAFNNIIHFACGDKTIFKKQKDNEWILADKRLYKDAGENIIDYKKKILFKNFKELKGEAREGAIIYSNNNERTINKDELLNIVNKYKDKYREILLLNEYGVNIDGVTTICPPVSNMFERFTTYIYTPTERKWDCSPRFIAECKYYGKEVVYYNIDYLDEDLGLYWRKWDIENDFDSIRLEDDDEIVNIVKGIIG